MGDFIINPWGGCQRPWGYEVRVDITQASTRRIFNEVLTFPSKITALDVKNSDKAIRILLDRIISELQDDAKSEPLFCPSCGRPL